MRRIHHWVDGKDWGGTADRTADVFEPSTGAVAAQVPLADATDVDAAVDAASRAYEDCVTRRSGAGLA